MAYSRAQVVAAIRRCFPPEEFERVAQALAGHQEIAGWSGDYARLHLAILKLSQGDFSQLHYYIQAAATDYRDVLWWAEYPPDSNVPYPDPYAEICGET